jgi:serine/threonine protein kinase
MPYAGETLEVYVKELYRQGRPTLIALLRLVLGMCRGVRHIRSLGWVHGDLKLLNVLVLAGEIKIIDLGEALRDRQVPEGVFGSEYFTPPERLENLKSPAIYASDVFALALILHFIMQGAMPFSGLKGDGVDAAYLNGDRADLLRPCFEQELFI